MNGFGLVGFLILASIFLIAVGFTAGYQKGTEETEEEYEQQIEEREKKEHYINLIHAANRSDKRIDFRVGEAE